MSGTFFVIATQNPVESHGAYPLPEAQLDRFAMKLRIGYPDPRSELAMLAANVGGNGDAHGAQQQPQARANVGGNGDAHNRRSVCAARSGRLRVARTFGVSPFRATVAAVLWGRVILTTRVVMST